jgi:general transcription factor 3C polypeptide 5 (transcription factor C subunit 1)
MGDYQYLPVMKNEKTGKTECIYDQIIPNDITAGPSWFRENKNALSFLPPLAFTRTDTPQYNVLKNDSKETDENVQQTNFSSSYRVVRSSYGIAIPFDYKPAPSKPNEKAKIVEDDELFDELKKMFEKQPVWTSTSLRAHVRNLKKRTITHYLASIAYAFTTGPWRNCFVRFGYDPRDNFDSRFYQILDFRIRRFAGSRVDIKTKRQYVSSQKRLKVPVKDEGNEEDDVEKDYQTRKNYAIFTLDTVPPSKAIHYMLIDIRVEQIQEMLINLAHSSSIICDEKRGWLPVGFMDKCRDIMTSIALENIIKLSKDKNISFDLKSDCTENPSEMLDDSSENETFDDIEMNENEV